MAVGSCQTSQRPSPIDTKFDPAKRDWAVVFVHEIREAVKHQDYGAYYFFLQELIKEDYRRTHNGEEMEADPELDIRFHKSLDLE